MKNPIIILLVATSLVFAIIQTKQKKPDTYCNPLLINGKPMNYSNFSLYSSGVLKMITSNVKDSNALKISFKIYLKRNDKILQIGASSNQKVRQAIEVTEILKLAIEGDELIIEPADKQYQIATQVIYLQKYHLTLQRNVFGFMNQKAEGC
jgi:hypothetical protein